MKNMMVQPGSGRYHEESCKGGGGEIVGKMEDFGHC